MMRDSAPKENRLADVLVAGAGLAGLSCACALRKHGIDVRVLEKSRGVGGRCATRRIEGQPVDHGLAFYHGDDPDFLSALRSVEPESGQTWPRRVVGEGAPCQPRAFHADQQRIAFASGVSMFPKHLARGVSVHLETRATRIDLDGDLLAVATESGQRYRARWIVLALPAGQSSDLLQTFEASTDTQRWRYARLTGGDTERRTTRSPAGQASGAERPRRGSPRRQE
jgi:predicted NAD/FAD-dependent oxidoreductase